MRYLPPKFRRNLFDYQGCDILEVLKRDLNAVSNPKSYYFVKKSLMVKELSSAYERTLDIGCGIGQNLWGDSLGIDLNLTYLKATKAQGKEVVVADAHHLPFRDCSFGFVIMSEVLEHLERPAEALEEARRVLRIGGRAFISTPLRWIRWTGHPGHLHYFSLHELRVILRKMGFVVKSSRGTTIPFIPLKFGLLSLLNYNKCFFKLWRLLDTFWDRATGGKATWEYVVLAEREK